MKYKITEVSDKHLVIQFKFFGFIEYWKVNKAIYSNIFRSGLPVKYMNKTIRIFKRILFLYKIGLLKRR